MRDREEGSDLHVYLVSKSQSLCTHTCSVFRARTHPLIHSHVCAGLVAAVNQRSTASSSSTSAQSQSQRYC